MGKTIETTLLTVDPSCLRYPIAVDVSDELIDLKIEHSFTCRREFEVWLEDCRSYYDYDVTEDKRILIKAR